MRRVHCKREPYDYYIGRPSCFGNPYRVGPDGDLDDVLAKYETWVRSQPQLMAKLPEIAGKTLGCWCHEYKGCHGDILIKLCEEVGLI